jgi:transposase-like protein
MARQPARDWTRAELAQVEQLYTEGVMPKEICERFGVSRDVIGNLIRKWGMRRHWPRLDKSLSREQQFAELLAEGYTIAQIARIMGYKDRTTANATFQRIRRKVGERAI